MSDVGSATEAAYNYYKNAVSDLEDENDDSQKRARERQDEYNRRLEENYAKETEKRNRRLEETAQDIRDHADKNARASRENARAEIEDLKKTYDRNGRYANGDQETLKKRIDSLEQQTANERARERAGTEKIISKYEDQSAESQKKADERLREAVDSARESSARANEHRNQEFAALKQEQHDRYRQLQEDTASDNALRVRELEKGNEDVQRASDKRVRDADSSNDARFEKFAKATIDANEESTRNLNKSHSDEMRAVRGQLRDLVEAESHYMKGKAEGRSDAYREFENENRLRHREIADAYEKQISGLQEKMKESDVHFAYTNDQNLREKDGYFAKLISKQNSENIAAQKQLETTYNHDVQALQNQVEHDRAVSSRTHDAQLTELHRQQDLALANQADRFQESARQQNLADRAKINMLEKSLHAHETSQDIAYVSPAAEEELHRQIAANYDRQFEAEAQRNRLGSESLRQNYQQSLEDAVEEKRQFAADFNRQRAAERHLEQSQFEEHIQDTEQLKETSLRDRDYQHSRETEKLNQSYTSLLAKQRQHYEELLSSSQFDANAKLNAARQEADFNTKMSMRASATKQNELIRDYEKKLADQKVEYDAVIDDLKSQMQSAQREADRRNRQALEDQSRSYEQRLAQQEYQYKERERYLTQNTQEEIEKVKRSNALIIQQKKS